MTTSASPIDPRTRRFLLVVLWIALTIGIIGSVITTEAAPQSLAAAVFAGLYVLAATATPPTTLRRPFALETLSLFGVMTAMAATTLTGNTLSPYAPLTILPPIFAVLVGGIRIGVATSLLSAAILVAVELRSPVPVVGSTLALASLYPILTLTVAQTRRLLAETQRRASELEESAAVRQRQLDALQGTHDLLNRLAEMTASDSQTAVDMGRAALESLVKVFPGGAATAAVESDVGLSIVARAGTERAGAIATVIPLTTGDRRVGRVELFLDRMLGPDERADLEERLRPLAYAFANVQLMDQIARDAIARERNRLARELHDEIGPSLASMGLALDVAMIETPGDQAVAAHLQHLRANVGRLVEDVRSTVADLRAAPMESLTARLNSVSADFPPEAPAVVIDIDERRPPRPSISPDLTSIATEAVRNAMRHSRAEHVRVSGWSDFDRGRIVVEDDGGGFDPSNVPRGHFGIIGMRERATELGIAFDLSSTDHGTRIAVEWGTSQR